MKSLGLTLVLTFAVSNVAPAYATQCFVGTVNGALMENTEPETDYELLFSMPEPGEKGQMNLYVGRNEIAGSSVRAEDREGYFRFENYDDSVFRANREGDSILLAIGGGQIEVNEAGELQISRKGHRRHELHAAPASACRRRH